MKTYHDIEQVMAHLSAQDAEILKQTNMIIKLLQSAGIPPEQIDAQETIGAGNAPGAKNVAATNSENPK